MTHTQKNKTHIRRMQKKIYIKLWHLEALNDIVHVCISSLWCALAVAAAATAVVVVCCVWRVIVVAAAAGDSDSAHRRMHSLSNQASKIARYYKLRRRSCLSVLLLFFAILIFLFCRRCFSLLCDSRSLFRPLFVTAGQFVCVCVVCCCMLRLSPRHTAPDWYCLSICHVRK